MTRRVFSAMILLSAALLQQFAQARQPNQDEPIRLRGELVVLDAQVLHKKTALAVDNLVREDFIVYEDGVKQHISHFSRDKLPLSVIVLVDVSGSVWPDLKQFERLRPGALEALKLLKREDEVALMQFAPMATLVQPFTRDRDLVVNALGRLNGRGERGTSVDEGILKAADYMRSASNSDSRRAIIAITDDVNYALTDRVDTVPTTKAEGEALLQLYESGSVVCALLYDTADSTDPLLEQPRTTEDMAIPRVKRGIAKHLAEATGGISIK